MLRICIIPDRSKEDVQGDLVRICLPSHHPAYSALQPTVHEAASNAMSTKKALKSIQLQIKDQSFEAALHEATTLLKALKKDDQEAAQVYVCAGLAGHAGCWRVCLANWTDSVIVD